jgi:voltage-gated potassium channel
MSNKPLARLTVRPYQIFMLVLCIYAILILAIECIVPLRPNTRMVLDYADFGVCLLFFSDFIISLANAPNRKRYLMQWGWIDLLSSVPTINVFRIGRLARIVRIFRLLRGFRATKILASFVLERRSESSFLAAVLVTILALAFSAIAVLHCENVPAGNIKSPEDAIWWALTTITTVGYGDRYPVTTEGRFIGAALMIVGVGLFGTLAGFIASWFLQTSKQLQRNQLDEIQESVDRLNIMVKELSQKQGVDIDMPDP